MPKLINAILALVIIAVIAGAVGGYIWWQGNQSINEILPVKEQVNKQEQAEQQKQGNAGTQNAPADWKIYKNDKYGFEFKYPKELSLNEGSDESAKNFPSQLLFNGPVLHGHGEMSISFQVFNNPPALNLQDYIIKNNYNPNDNPDYKDPMYKDLVKIGWINLKRDSIDIWSNRLKEALGGFEGEIDLQNTKNMKQVIVTNFGSSNDAAKELANEEYKIYSQIISTFKFTK